MRTLVLTIVIFNVTFGAAWSVLVLYSIERLHLGHLGFGLLTSAAACGGIVGTFGYGWLERHVSLGTMLKAGLTIETFTHLGLALTTTPWVAMSIFFVFGAHAFVWGTLSTSVRQRAVPTGFQGRVQSVYMIGVTGGIVVGSILGGLIADRWGVTGAVLVRLRRVRAVPGADLEPAGVRRPRRRGDPGRPGTPPRNQRRPWLGSRG